MGEAGFTCPNCAEPMLHAEEGTYICQPCNRYLRLVDPGVRQVRDVYVSPPRSPEEVEEWLRSYLDWRAQLAAAGLYTVPSDTGTRIQSNRQGRPTERAAILLTVLAAKCRMVEDWLQQLPPDRRRLADYYLGNGKPSIVELANERNEEYECVKKRVQRLTANWNRICA